MEAAQSVAYQYRINPTVSPKTIELTGLLSSAERAESELLGIYEFDGPRLRVCLVKHLPMIAGQQRPEDFLVEPGSGEVLFLLERDQPSEDEKAIRAAWDFASITEDGRGVPPEQFDSIQFVFSDFEFFLAVRKPPGGWASIPGGPAGLYTFLSDNQPRAINLYIRPSPSGLAQFSPPLFKTLPPEKQVDLLGIYELTNDRLRIAYRAGGPRPAEFTSEPGSGVTLLELKRQPQERDAENVSGAPPSSLEMAASR
jgi:uncharacterized protein (TIGR03067 family)